NGLRLAVGLVVGELVDDAYAIFAVLLGPVAGLAGLARGGQVVDGRGNRTRIGIERHREYLPHAGKLALHEPSRTRSNVAAYAIYARVRGILIRRVFGLHHAVTGLAAEGGCVHVAHRAISELARDHDIQHRGAADEVHEAAKLAVGP